MISLTPSCNGELPVRAPHLATRGACPATFHEACNALGQEPAGLGQGVFLTPAVSCGFELDPPEHVVNHAGSHLDYIERILEQYRLRQLIFDRSGTAAERIKSGDLDFLGKVLGLFFDPINLCLAASTRD